MASSSSGNRARLDQIAAEFLAKGLRVILDARLDSRSAAAEVPAAASARSGPSRAGASARWFNLELGSSAPDVLQAVEGWRRQARGEPLVLEILLVSTPARSEPMVSPGGALPLVAGPRQSFAGRAFASSDAFISLLGNVPVQAGFSPAAPGRVWQGPNSPAAGLHGALLGRESSGGSVETVTLVERWVLNYERKMTPGTATSGGVAPSMGSMRASLGGSGGAAAPRGLRGARCASAADVSATGPGSPLSTSRAAMPGEPQDAGTGLEIPTVYKHLVVLLRSLYSLARVLPAYRLHTSLESASHKSDFRLTFRIGSAPAAVRSPLLGERPAHVHVQLPEHPHAEPQELREPASLDGSGLTNRISVDPVEMPGGRLTVSVAYCHTTTVTATEVSPPLIPHLIADYVGSPMTDSVRRYSQSETPLSPAVVPRRAVHVIPIVSAGSAAQGSNPTLPSPSSFPSSPASLPTDHAVFSPAQGQGQRRASGPALPLPGSRFPQARSLSGTAASASPAYSPALAMVPAGSSAPVHPTRTLTAGAARPRAEEVPRVELAMSQSPWKVSTSDRRSGLALSPMPPSSGLQQALSYGTSSFDEQLRQQPQAQQGLMLGLQGQQAQPWHPHWQQELLRQHQQEQRHGGGGWKASAPLSIPRHSARPGAISLAEAQVGALGSGSAPRSQGSGGSGSCGSQGTEQRLPAPSLSRGSVQGLQEPGLGLHTIGTAPHAVIQGPVPFLSGASPAQTWMPASAPGHAALIPGLGAMQVDMGANSREASTQQRGTDAPGAPPVRPQLQTCLPQHGGRAGISAAPSSALTAALAVSAAHLPGHPAPMSGQASAAAAVPGDGATQVQRGFRGDMLDPPEGMQVQWGAHEAHQSATSEVDITRQSRVMDDEADESIMDLPFAVDEDEESTNPGREKPALPSQGEHPHSAAALHHVSGAGMGAQTPAPPGLLWDMPATQPPRLPRGASAGSGSAGLSSSSGAQMRAAAVGALVRLLKSAPPLRLSPSLEGALAAGAGGLGSADPLWRVEAGERPSDSSARAMPAAASQLQDAAMLGLGASWLSHSTVSSVLAAPRQGLTAGPWQGLGKSLGAAAQELKAFRELRDALVRQKGDRPQRRQGPGEPGPQEPLAPPQQQPHPLGAPGPDLGSASSRAQGSGAGQEEGERGGAKVGSAAAPWYSFGKHTGCPR